MNTEYSQIDLFWRAFDVFLIAGENVSGKYQVEPNSSLEQIFN